MVKTNNDSVGNVATVYSINIQGNENENDKTENDNDRNKEEQDGRPEEFEAAIAATGYGIYNIMLILIAVPAGWSSLFETTTMSYVFPAAQCDLSLSLSDKGLLNAITYLGMISSALIWGFLADTWGRKKLLCLGFFLDGMLVVLSSFSQSLTFLIVTKYLGGLIINGPFAALMSYVAEFHSAQYRARFQMILGSIFSFGGVVLPLIAWSVLPVNWDVSLFGWLDLHSWNFYILMCSIPALSSCVIFMILPETPKFLMTKGHNEKALQVLRRVYHWNTFKMKEDYPIHQLKDELQRRKSKKISQISRLILKPNNCQVIKKGWRQIRPMFHKPYLWKMILLCLMQAMVMMCLNTFRLWMPQIFQSIVDYQVLHNGTTASLCTMLDSIIPKNSTECFVNMDNASVYENSMIVTGVSVGGYVFATYFINTVGKKRILFVLNIMSGLCAVGIYFSQSTAATLTLFSLLIAGGSIANNVICSVIIDFFPTSLRTMTLALAMMCGRAAAMMGNLIFPILLQTGCAPPFFSIAVLLIGCGFLTILLPNTDMKAME